MWYTIADKKSRNLQYHEIYSVANNMLKLHWNPIWYNDVGYTLNMIKQIKWMNNE